MKRLQAHRALGRIQEEQPAIAPEPREAVPIDVKSLQKKQILAAISKGQFSSHAELDEEYCDFLRTLNPEYTPPTEKDIPVLKEALHKERIKERDLTLKQMGPGGVVTDGCRGKLVESLINFLYIEGLSGTSFLFFSFLFFRNSSLLEDGGHEGQDERRPVLGRRDRTGG